MTMKKKSYNGATAYVSPELTCTDISVETGFAASGETFDDMALDAPDYGDGVTL